MSTAFRGSDAWAALRNAAKSSKGPAHVAVAYFGQGGAGLLPLRRGSRLVVNAGEQTVKSGQTCPAELAKLVKRKVRVYSDDCLHAKVFVFNNRLFVGSTNVSRMSEGRLNEAIVETSDRRAIIEARRFVKDLCLHELGPEAIKRLGKIYRPRKFGNGRQKRRDAVTGIRPGLPRIRIVRLTEEEPPEESRAIEHSGRIVARKRMLHPRRHTLDSFFWKGPCDFKPGDSILQVLEERDGTEMVYPPGDVVNLSPWRGGTRSVTFVYLEVPAKRRMALGRLAKRIGPGAKERLKKNGKTSREFGWSLYEAWKLKEPLD